MYARIIEYIKKRISIPDEDLKNNNFYSALSDIIKKAITYFVPESMVWKNRNLDKNNLLNGVEKQILKTFKKSN